MTSSERSGKYPGFLKKAQILDQRCCYEEKMNQGVFLSVLRLQFSSFHRRKILLLLTVPNAQVQKSFYCNEKENEPVYFSGQHRGCNYQLSKGDNTAFTLNPNSQVHKDMLQYSVRGVKTLLGHTVPFPHKKEFRGKCSMNIDFHVCCHLIK